MTAEKVQERITSLVNTLETRAVWIGVDGAIYSPMVYRGKPLNPAALISKGESFPSRGNHAVALVGYDLERNQFLVKDSNLPDVVYINADGFVSAVATGLVLRKI